MLDTEVYSNTGRQMTPPFGAEPGGPWPLFHCNPMLNSEGRELRVTDP